MKFSIIVPVYNVELYLSECLESILGQTYQDYEVICVNDASTDKSYNILKEYAQENRKIRVFYSDVNRGVSFSRNKGIDEAKGDYILFVDSDDMLNKDTLEKLDNVLQENDVDIACHNFIMKNEGKVACERNILRKEKAVFSTTVQTGQSLFIEMSRKDYFFDVVWSYLYKREFLNNYGLRFYEGIVHEDVLFAVECMLVAARAIFINEDLYIYRKRDHSITTTTTELHLDSFIIVIGEIMQKWRTYQLEDGMDSALMKYIDRYIARINRLCALFPNHNRLAVGTAADQFLFEIFKGIRRKQLRYVKLEAADIQSIRKYEEVIVFGAGEVATELISCLIDHNIKVEAVAVSDKTINMDEIYGIHIHQIEELLNMREKALVIIGVIKRNQMLIVQKLQGLGFKNILCIDTDKVVINRENKFANM